MPEFLYDEPLTISRISFNKKTQIENHVLMIGDTAGLIAPLCGNGMSMALHSSKLAFEEIDLFLQGRINRYEMEIQYTQQWEKLLAAAYRLAGYYKAFSEAPSFQTYS